MIISGIFIQFALLDNRYNKWDCELKLNFDDNSCDILTDMDIEEFEDSKSTYRFIAEFNTETEYEIFEIEFKKNNDDWVALKDREYENFFKYIQFLNLKDSLSIKDVKSKNNLKI